MKNIPVKPKLAESFFFNLESQSAMPGIAGLATVGILIEAERQENWFQIQAFTETIKCGVFVRSVV